MGVRERLRAIGPGILVAATGVGAGDLATAAFTGNRLGLVVLWAVLVGALLKLTLNEGLARWQLATGETLLEGALTRLGRPVRYVFLAYLVLWSWFVGSALVSACGVTTHALVPVFARAEHGKIVFGIAASLAGVVLVRRGGYRLFGRVMSACIGLMFLTVIATAVLIRPDWGEVARGLVVPRIPDAQGAGLSWTVALVGGVGGTLTVLCYGYWIREEGRTSPADLGACRVDLVVGYAMTAVFGIAMVIIGSRIQVEGQGAGLIVALAERLEEPLGSAGRWVFLIGAFGAVFSSLLGVWQSVPYLFADSVGIARGGERAPVDTSSPAYRAYLWALALVPLVGLWFSFRAIQKAYALVGASFLPLLALALLVLNGRRDWVGARLVNRAPTLVVLVAAIVFFVAFGWLEITGRATG